MENEIVIQTDKLDALEGDYSIQTFLNVFNSLYIARLYHKKVLVETFFDKARWKAEDMAVQHHRVLMQNKKRLKTKGVIERWLS